MRPSAGWSNILALVQPGMRIQPTPELSIHGEVSLCLDGRLAEDCLEPDGVMSGVGETNVVRHGFDLAAGSQHSKRQRDAILRK